MVDKTAVLTATFAAALAVGVLMRLFNVREMMESGTYRAACWSDGDCGPDGRCDDVLGCVPRGAQPKVEKQAAGKLLEQFSMQEAPGGPVTNAPPNEFAPIDVEQDLWSPAPAPAPLRPYDVADDNQLFQYQNAPMRPECCPATISGDMGCLCLTKEQERQLATRGGNRVTLK